jgi:membrane protein implicated in regulation of membrane protease activity
VALLIGGTLSLLFLDPPWSIAVIVLLAGVEVGELFLWRWAWRRRPLSGVEALVGQRGKLLDGKRVRIAGTTYPARTGDASPGDEVIVERTDGMTLIVRRAP